MAKWNYDACGLYLDYKGHVIIKQNHPNLEKYLICKENKDLELLDIATTSTLKGANEIITNITDESRRFN